MNKKKDKLCYILPLFDLKTDSHFYHIYDFINKAAVSLDLTLIIEKNSSDTSFFSNVSHVQIQRFTFLPLRIIENLFLIIQARITGCKKFYIHYSYISALNSSIICKLTGGKNWYWNCGMMWLFKKDRLNQFLIKISLHSVNYLVTGAESLIDGYSENYKISKDKIKVMPNWIDPSRFNKKYNRDSIIKKFSLRDGKYYILFLHRLVQRKGVNYIIPIAKQFGSDYTFIIAGDGPYKETLRNKVLEANLKNVQIIGKVSNDQVPQLMNVADVFFMPSEEEGFPRVLAEAMASGLPYVASDIGGVKEISPTCEQEYIYPVGDLEGFVFGIKKILTTNKSSFENCLKKKSNDYNQSDVLNIFINLFK
jgi:glycosyltransferase involved in cell wall biosynthesis